MLRARRVAFVLGSIFALSCRPSARSHDPAVAGDPGPPAAPVVATLTPYGAVAGDDRVASGAASPIAVVEHWPEGEGWNGSTVTLKFNQPMLAASLPKFTFDPPLEGSVQWVDAFRVSFNVTAGETYARAFTVKVGGEVESVDGDRKTLDLAWSLATERPGVTIDPMYDEWNWYGNDTKRSWRTGFDIRATSPVTAAALRKAIRVTARPVDGSGEAVEVPFTLERTEKAPKRDAGYQFALRPRVRWPLASVVKAEIAPTLVSTDGPLPVVRGASASIETTPGVEASVDCSDAFDGGCGPSRLDVAFTHPVPTRTLRQITVSPRPKGLKIASWYDNEGTITNASIDGEFVVGKRYRVRVADSVRDVKGHPLAGKHAFDIDIVPPSPSLNLSASEGILPVAQGSTIGIESRYLADVTLEVAPLDDAALAFVLATPINERVFPKRAAIEKRKLELTTSGAYAWSSTAIDLVKELGKKRHAAFVRVQPGALLPSAKGKNKPSTSQAVYQVTDLGAFVGLSPAFSFVRVSRLSTGAPVEGAHATVYEITDGKARAHGKHGPSDADGIIRLPAEEELPGNAIAVIATKDDRFAVRMSDAARMHRDWHGGSTSGDRLLSTLLTDRPLYKAGETVRVMGWAAKSTSRTASTLTPAGRPMVELEIFDSRDRVVAKRTVRVKEYGKYWGTLKLPEEAPLGGYEARAQIDGENFSTRFEVRDFRTPAFDVRAAATDGDLLHGAKTVVNANASYLHGMAAPIVEARFNTWCYDRAFTPDTHPDWTAATITTDSSSWSLGSGRPGLDAEAAHGHIDFELDTTPLPVGGGFGCRVDLAVQDAAREEMGADVAFNVHPSRYLMLGPLPWSVDADTKVTVDVQATDFTGKAIAGGDVKVKLERTWWEDGADKREPAGSCRRKIAADGATRCTFTPKKLGAYEVLLSGTVDGAKVTTRRSFHVWQRAGKPEPKSEIPTWFELTRNVEQAPVGDEVVLTIASPDATGSAVLARMHGGLRGLEAFQLKNHRASRTLKVADSWIPRMRFAAFMTTAGTRKQLPAIRSAFAEVSVPHESRNLTVGVASPDSVGPGDAVSIDVDVRDAGGLPAASHVTVWAVDEAILALQDFSFPDFVGAFAYDRGSEAKFGDDFALLVWPYTPRDDPWESGIGLGGFGSGGGGSGAGYGGLGSRGPAPVRRKFDATPIFIADAYTGDDGRVTVEGTMPENLTTFRVVAIASASLKGGKAIGRFGRGETRTRVTTDLAVRPVLPRVMRPGDVAEVAALVDNLAAAQGQVTVELALKDNDGVAKLRSKATKRMAASAQLRVPFELEALAPGKVKVLVSVSLAPDGGGKPLADAMEAELPVTVERTMIKRAAHYGSMASEDEALAVAVQRPEEAAAGSLDVEVAMHTSLLGGYKDNVEDLVLYPYGCVEQTTTRLVPLLALADLGKRYPLGIENEHLFMEAAFARLQTMQTSEGGFGYWPGATDTHFYATAYATWVLGMARTAGHDVPDELLAKPRRYLADRLHMWSDGDIPTTDEDVRMAMALHAVASSGLEVSRPTTRLYERADELPIFAQTLLLMAMHERDPGDERVKELLAKLLKSVDEREAFARTRAPSVQYTQFFDSAVRTDAMMLLALTKVAPDHALVEKFARGLSRARDAGQLHNTQENAYALVAMAAYARLREVEEPDLFARAWLGLALVDEATFQGRDFAVHEAETNVPVQGADAPKVTLAKQGSGRLYYRVGMKWVPAEMPKEPVAQGFAVERTLRNAAGAATTKIAAGELATIDLAVTADVQQDYVVVEVPLPAGLEAVDTSLGKGASARVAAGGGGWWADHREIHGDRVLFFVDHLAAGRHTMSIPLRATTPGRYRMPPARAESMYYPEIFGYTPGDDVHVASR